jgi:acyl carrier protein
MTESRDDLVDHDYAAPVGELETAVSGIIAEVLGVDRIGRTDSFYDFGGTSLQAIRICARIEAKLGIQAVPLWLFDNDVLVDFVGRLNGAAEGLRG